MENVNKYLRLRGSWKSLLPLSPIAMWPFPHKFVCDYRGLFYPTPKLCNLRMSEFQCWNRHSEYTFDSQLHALIERNSCMIDSKKKRLFTIVFTLYLYHFCCSRIAFLIQSCLSYSMSLHRFIVIWGGSQGGCYPWWPTARN